jgi:hypothetical protein
MPSHINSLHETLDEVIEGLKKETIKIVDAKEITNAAGKRITAFRTQLEYYKLRKERPRISALK